ncbi:hypothetical protein BDA96_09G089900 [Sorghum bicolor]|jgi:hypothetical protein|uniref:C2H2-type domain-containing protein n=1 Tax=Sorghum bicolor TaxID=4558 RepID=A0A921Q8Y9_SORBI|nr:hypothetical protein BDA96_09G089900 [Sorghum bicolor]
MESGSNMESKAASAGYEAMTSPMLEPVAAAAGGATAREDDEVAPPAPGSGEAPPLAPAASPKPYYECVFCKRGFTTAQALGGHMNIHRRDRAKPTRDSPTSSGITTVSRNVECYNKYRHLLAPSSYPPAVQPIPIPIGAGSSFGMYYTSSVAAAGARLDAESGNPNSVSPRELSLFDEASRDQDLHLGLGRLQGHIVVVGEGSGAAAEGSSERQESGEPERELDLELRLGRCPSRH